MQCALFSLLGLPVLGCLLPVAATAGSGFLAGTSASAAGCVANGEACQEGVDCCGVCAYIGADTWRCQACTPLGEECIPMGNRCCDGGDKREDVHLSQPMHECKATEELSSRYGITKYTCQAADLHELDNVTRPAGAPEAVPQALLEQQGSEERADSNEKVSVPAVAPEAVPQTLVEQQGSEENPNVTMPAVAPEVVPQALVEQRGSEEERAESSQCTPDGEACRLGVDCCGVCVFMGRGSECQTCVAPGGACFDPYSNPCCGGATKRYDQGIVDPAYTCQSTGQTVGPYGIEQYTCQPAKP